MVVLLESARVELLGGGDAMDYLKPILDDLNFITQYFWAPTDVEKEKIFRERSGI